MNIRSKTAILFLLSASLGALIWCLCPFITGEVEPLDAGNYYLISLIGTGILMGVLGPKGFWLWPIAIYLGQFSYIILYSFLGPYVGVNFFFTPMWMGMISLAIITVLSLIGSAVGSGLRILVEKLKK